MLTDFFKKCHPFLKKKAASKVCKITTMNIKKAHKDNMCCTSFFVFSENFLCTLPVILILLLIQPYYEKMNLYIYQESDYKNIFAQQINNSDSFLNIIKQVPDRSWHRPLSENRRYSHRSHNCQVCQISPSHRHRFYECFS